MTDTLPDVLTDAEWKAFIGQFNETAPTGLRNKAMMRLMHDAGLRVSEVIRLQRKDIKPDEVEGQVVTALELRETKAGGSRVVYISGEAERLLNRWLEVRQAEGIANAKRVFTTLKGKGLDDGYIRAMVARKGEDAGIEWRVHPHALRHTYATNTLEREGDLALVQDALGHKRADTTRVYAKVRPQRLARAALNAAQEQGELALGDDGGDEQDGPQGDDMAATGRLLAQLSPEQIEAMSTWTVEQIRALGEGLSEGMRDDDSDESE